MSKASISLLIPTYVTNVESMKHLLHCLRSIAVQISGPDEIVICDDSKGDYVSDVLRGIHFNPDIRILYTKNNKRLGLAQNYNACLEKATSSFVHLFAQDEALLSVHSYMKIRQSLVSDQPLDWYFVEGLNQFRQSGKVQVNERLLLGINEYGGLSSLVFPNTQLIRLDEKLVQLVDTDLMYSLKKTYGPPKLVPGPLFAFGYGSHQTANQVPLENQESELRYLIQKHHIPITRICEVLKQHGPRNQKKLIARAIKGS